MDQKRGLLDLEVALSTPDAMAGQPFSIYVLVKNPFDVPIWITRVHVSVPNEIDLPQWEKVRKATEAELERQKQEAQEEQETRNSLINEEAKRRVEMKDIDEQITTIGEQLKGISNDSEILQLRQKLDGLRLRREELALFTEQFNQHGSLKIVCREGSTIYKPKIIPSVNTKISVTEGSTLYQMEMVDPKLQYAEAQLELYRTVDLQSSLPEGTSLQPGNTAVFTVIMNTKNTLLFRPSQYRLQFSVNYGFENTLGRKIGIEESTKMVELFTNTIAMTLSIRASIYSVIVGASVGAFFGAIARLFQFSAFTASSIGESLISIMLSVILGVVAIIFLARKSGVQSFVSVEDFWGGLLIGFLAGYTGVSFFQELTGLSAPSSDQTIAAVSLPLVSI